MNTRFVTIALVLTSGAVFATAADKPKTTKAAAKVHTPVAPTVKTPFVLPTKTNSVASAAQPRVSVPSVTTNAVVNELGPEIKNLTPTGEYVERYMHVPEGNQGGTKLVKFLVPVYRQPDNK